MSKTAKILIGCVVMILAILAVPWNRQSDSIQIRQALSDAIVAGQEGRPGKVLDFLTSRFAINGQEIANRNEIARMIRLMRPKVDLKERNLDIASDKATMVVDFEIDSDSPQFPMKAQVKGARLEFRREGYRRWLIFPDSRWQLDRITMDEELPTGSL